jgi:hypothetical protein
VAVKHGLRGRTPPRHPRGYENSSISRSVDVIVIKVLSVVVLVLVLVLVLVVYQ